MNKANSGFKAKSLKRKITVWVIIVVLISQGLFSFLRILTDSQELFDELNNTSETISRELSESIRSPLWNYDFDQTKNLINIKLANRDFIGVVIYDSKNDAPLIGLVKNGDMIEETVEISGDQYLNVSREISYENTVQKKIIDNPVSGYSLFTCAFTNTSYISFLFNVFNANKLELS